MSARFLIAKYVPEPRRMEPVNVGVVVWLDGAVESRFVPDDATFLLRDREGFVYWKQSCEALLQENEIRPPRMGRISRADVEYLAAFRRFEEDHFRLVDGGFVTDRIGPRDLPTVADFLFSDLVAPPRTDRPERLRRATEAVRKVIADSGCGDRLARKYGVRCTMHGVEKTLRFSFGTGIAEQPHAVLERVDLRKDESVYDAAFKMENVTRYAKLSKARCAAIVYEDEEPSGDVESNRRLMQELCTLINVARHDEAVESVRNLVLST